MLRAAARYTIGLILVAFLALCGAFWAATRPWFVDNYVHNEFKIIGYGRRSVNKNCDVVLYGDSTALTGLDPSVIERDTGMTACNISEVSHVLEVTGTHLPLDQYLAHNRPPRFLITAWSPGYFDLEHPPMEHYYGDGFLYEFQYNRHPWLWRNLILHPKDTFTFLLWVQSAILERKLGFIGPDKVDQRSMRDAHNGQWQPAIPAQTSCEQFPVMPWVSLAKARDSVAKFREEYRGRTQHLIVDITPVADCYVEGRLRIAAVQGLHDNTAQTWPVGNFHVANIHLTPEGAQRFSEQVAEQIEAILQQDRKNSGEHSAVSR